MNRITLKASIGALAIAGLFTLSSCHPDPDPVIPALTDYCGDVTTSTTWTNNREGVDYRVSCPFTITADMVIEEGTEIEFKDGTGIIVGTGGYLMVKGTAANMVNMHGNGVGTWWGLWFQSSSEKNELKYCIVNGGGQTSFNGHDIKANVRLSLTGKLSIMNSTISNSGRDGLYIEGLDDANLNPLVSFSNNMFSNNANYPITTVATAVTKLDGTSSTYAGNGNANIEVRGGALFGNHSWVKNTIPYLVTGEIRAGYYDSVGNLTINAGVTMKFLNDFGITVGEYSTGYLRMTGTASEHITLMSGDANAWQGVGFQSMNAQNLLSYVDIDKGGSTPFTGAPTKKANIVVGGFSAGAATIQNCSVTNSAAYGIYVTNTSTNPTVTGVTYSGNTQANYYDEP